MNTLQQLLRLLGIGTENTGERVTLDTNKSYILKATPILGTIKVYYAGLRFTLGVEYGLSIDVTGKIVTLTFNAPFPVNPDDIIVVDYRSF